MRDKNWKQLIGGRTGLLIIGALIILNIILALIKIVDLPHLSFGAPVTPINWTEIVIDIAVAFFIGLIAVTLIRLSESKRKKTEEALRESEKKYRDLIENINDFIYTLDLKGNVTSANKAAFEALEYTSDDLYKKNFKDLIPEKYQAQALKDFQTVLERGEIRNATTVLESKTGKEIWVEFNSTAIVKDGKVVGTRGIARDITERKKVEQETEAQKRKLETYIESITDGVSVNDVNGIITHANATCLEMYGCKSKEEMIGKPIFEFVAEKELPGIRKRFMQAVKTKEKTIKNLEIIARKKDGSEFPVLLSTAFIWDEEGNLADNITIIKDITERKKAEEALRESEERLHSIFSASPDYIYLTDPQGNFLNANPALLNLQGLSLEQLQQKNVFDFFSGDDPEKLMQAADRLRAGEEVRELQAQARIPSGEVRYFEVNAVPLKENGKVIEILSVARDITERKKAEEKIKQAAEEWERTFDSISDLVSVHDKDFRFVKVNKTHADLFKMKPEEFIGKTCYEIIHGTKKPWPNCPHEQAMEIKKPVTAEFFEPRLGIDIEVSVSPIFNEKNEIVGTVHIVKDITERKKAEETLKSQKDKLQALMDGLARTQIGIDIVGIDYKILFQNQTLKEKFGDLTGKLCYEKYMGLKKPCDFCPVIKAIKHNKVESIELHGIDGRNYKLFSAPLPNPDGTVDKAIEVVMDITERKRAEEALRFQSEIAANMSEGVYLIRASDGVIVYTNPKFEEIFGYGHGEMIGKHVSIVNAPTEKSPEETAKEIMEFINKHGFWRGEINNIKKDGTPFWCYASVSMFDHPEHGRVWVVVHTDITERKKAEEELRLFSHSVDSSIDGIAMGSLDGRITYVNETFVRMFGYSREELIGKEIAFIYSKDQIPKLKKVLKKTMEGGWTGELVGKRKDGELFPIMISASRVLDAKGKVVAQMASHRDITDRKRLQQQLIQSEKLIAVETLAYGIAHEFNNILAGILANAELGLLIRDSKQKKECFESIVDCSHRASSITHNLLAFTQQKDVKKELNDITEPLKSVLSLVHRELEKANIKIVEKFKPIPKIFCDQGQFSEVFLNMLTNARDAMRPKGGTLTVKVEPYKDDIRIVFRDTGCGIPENIKGRIFDPFVTTKGPLGGSDIPGTGLGLFLAHGIIDSYQGKIEVESKEGFRTKFTILIPISENLPRKSLLETEIKPTKEIKRKLNILLVDDEKPICITLKKFLESKGHKVTTSLRAKEGLGFFKKDKFDVVLSDLTIPDMDGIELIKKMKKEDEKSKIIVLTGHIAREMQKKAKEAGANEVLIKPFKNQTLYQTISELVFE